MYQCKDFNKDSEQLYETLFIERGEVVGRAVTPESKILDALEWLSENAGETIGVRVTKIRG